MNHWIESLQIDTHAKIDKLLNSEEFTDSEKEHIIDRAMLEMNRAEHTMRVVNGDA